MATNVEILAKIGPLKDSIDEVLELAKSNDRALRGHNSTIGLVARVKSIEDKMDENKDDRNKKLDRQAKVLYGTGASVIGAIIIDTVFRFIN